MGAWPAARRRIIYLLNSADRTHGGSFAGPLLARRGSQGATVDQRNIYIRILLCGSIHKVK